MTNKGTVVGDLASNITHYPGRSDAYRVRFRVGGVQEDFGYYPDYYYALGVRNLVADRLGRPRADENEMDKLSFEDVERIVEECSDVMEKAEVLGDEFVDQRTQRTNVAQLKKDLTRVENELKELKRTVHNLVVRG